MVPGIVRRVVRVASHVPTVTEPACTSKQKRLQRKKRTVTMLA